MVCLFAANLVIGAEEPTLPEGRHGIASAFPADASIAQHKDVIFNETFEEPNYKYRWDDVKDEDGEVLSLTDNTKPLHGLLGRHALKVAADLEKNTGGNLTKWFESSDQLFIRYYVKFDPNCDYIHHFGILRANKSLNGSGKWTGFGGAGKKPVGDDRFSTAVEPWGNWKQVPAPGMWHFYTYWHEMEGSRDGNYWGNSFDPETPIQVPKDQWICVEFMVDHNTPGVADGSQAFWIDGKLAGHWKGINWRTSDSLWANAYTLESYVTDRWTKNRFNTVYFDNLVIAKSYIGPSSDGKSN